MPSKLFSVELLGLEGAVIEIEVDKRPGIPVFKIVGLPDAAVQEASERVRSAIRHSDFEFPRGKVVVNLAPADLRKTGPRFDLPIAMGIMGMMGMFPNEQFKETAMIGELALSGEVRPVQGVLPSVEFAKTSGFKKIILPAANASEANVIGGIEVMGVHTLTEAVDYLSNKLCPVRLPNPTWKQTQNHAVDMTMVKGQAYAKRALEIAAAGGHNILLSGTPGSGKTLMAKAMSSILPSMSMNEKLEVTKVYSVAGLLPKEQPIIHHRPFRTVHHTASAISIVGGGNNPSPGEISLAHRGILFMDEIAEFPKHVLEVLRQPMEDRQITVSRVKGSFTYPSQFSLVASMNPCPCGYFGAEQTGKTCTCAPIEIKRYQKKLSGPLLDRIDLFVKVNPVKTDKLLGVVTGDSSAVIQKRVETALQKQTARLKNDHLQQNAEMNNPLIEKYCRLQGEADQLLQQAMQTFDLSARSYFRILKVARTIADLDGSEAIQTNHLSEALQYRQPQFE